MRILIDHLEAGDRLEDFLTDFPTVSQDQVIALLERAMTVIESDSDEAEVIWGEPRGIAPFG